MLIIKKILSLLLRVVIVSAIFFLFFWFRGKQDMIPGFRNLSKNIQENVEPERKFPEKINPKTLDFRWTYNKKSYEISEILYGSVYDFYASSPKDFEYQGDLPADWKEKYFAMFLEEAGGNDAIQKIAGDIKAAGVKNTLNDDQIAELIMSFVQSIPYDDAKAREILSGEGHGLVNYPYETLYENKGVCSDKSFLAFMILRHLGYGTALFVYESENHMAVAVQCPSQYSTYGSGYCYAETTTSGNKIGMIPTLSADDNKAQAVKKINYFDLVRQNQVGEKKLGPVEIYESTSGKNYSGIINTVKTIDQISFLGAWLAGARPKLTEASSRIKSKQSELDAMDEKMDKYLKKGDYEEYNEIAPEYNELVSKLKKEIKEYNAQVEAYNQTVNQYNALVAGFQ